MRDEKELHREVAEAKRQLQETHDELQAIYDVVPDGLIIVDVETGQCLRANEQMACMLGYTLDELPRDPAAVHRPEDLPDLAERFRAQVEGRLPVAQDVPFLHRDGSDVYTDISGTPIVYKGRPCLLSFVRDVTERHKAEMAVRESEAKYRSLANASPDAVCMFDLDGRILLASQQTWTLLGLPPETELVGCSVFDLLVEEREHVAANLRDAVEKGVRRNSEYTLRRADNTTVPIEVSSAVVRGPEDEPIALTAVVRDISERKQAQAALRESHDELLAIHDGVSDGLVIVDIEARQCIRANARWCEMLGYAEHELPMRPQQVHPVDEIPAIEKKFRAMAEGRQSLVESVPFLRKDGSIFLADITGNRIEYHGRPCLLSFIRDTTERHRADEALRQSEERFRVVFEEAPVGMVIAKLDRTIIRVNKAICRMTGYTPEDLIGENIQSFMHPDDIDVSAPFVEKLLAGEIASFTVERRYLAKDGRPFWSQATTAAICGADGKLAFGLGIVENIDERKRAKEALERERKTLWHMLRSSDHERQLIAYDIHDGLAQHLAAATMQFQTYEQIKTCQPDSAKTAFDAGMQMLRQAHSETRRLISGVRPPILDESGIVAALAHLVHDQPQTGEPRIEFQSHVQFGRLESVLENAIYRIAQEALANAVKHSQSPRVKIAIDQVGESIRLVVQDWGVGFDTRAQDENRFGLDGIRERTRLLGGQIEVESRSGRGTTIEVVLPLMLAAD